MPRKVDSLPTDILILIFEYFELDLGSAVRERGDSRELVDLCLVSQLCRNVAQPLLFKTFDGRMLPRGKLFLFMRTLIERPAITRHIRHLDVDTFDTFKDNGWSNTTHKILDRNAEESLHLAIVRKITSDPNTHFGLSSFQWKAAETYVQQAQIPGMNALTPLLLSFLYDNTSLELNLRLWIRENTTKDEIAGKSNEAIRTEIACRKLLPATPTWQPFSGLRRCMLNDVSARSSIWTIGHMFHFPALREFHLMGFWGQSNGEVPQLWPCAPCKSTITRLYLSSVKIDHYLVEAMVNSCALLTHFELTPTPGAPARAIDLTLLSNTLRQHCKTLRSLTVNVADQANLLRGSRHWLKRELMASRTPSTTVVSYHTASDRLGSLVDFTSLEFVCIPAFSLCPPSDAPARGRELSEHRIEDLLPASVKHAVLRKYEITQVFHHVHDISSVAKRLRHLRKVELVTEDDLTSVDCLFLKVDRELMEEQFAEKNITLSVR